MERAIAVLSSLPGKNELGEDVVPRGTMIISIRFPLPRFT
jgi:hypothetical protein